MKVQQINTIPEAKRRYVNVCGLPDEYEVLSVCLLHAQNRMSESEFIQFFNAWTPAMQAISQEFIEELNEQLMEGK